MAKKDSKVKRIDHCCPHTELPRGMTEGQAIDQEWFRGLTKGKPVWICPKGFKRACDALMAKAERPKFKLSDIPRKRINVEIK